MGDFNWRFIPHLEEGRIQGMAIVMPNERNGQVDWLPVVQGPAPSNQTAWGWDGNQDKPTLTPSLLLEKVVKVDPLTKEQVWHGHMTAGRLESC